MACERLRWKLEDGTAMPMIGFGTYQITGQALVYEVLDYALAAGYRSIDTAAVYHNEKDIGIALGTLLPKYKLNREDIFITSKLPPSHHGDSALSAVERSVDNLNCVYLDLYLVHWPGQQDTTTYDTNNSAVRRRTWQLLTQAKNDGLTKNIGVSNYTVGHLRELLSDTFGVKPAVNQIEWHPHYHQEELKELCDKEHILVQAYSSLGGTRNSKLISDATVLEIASKLNKSPSQILLRWSLQQNVAIIPKARSKKHIINNISLDFEIPEEDMDALDHLPQQKYAWDPTLVA